MVKLIVYLVKLFEKENPALFKGKAKGVSMQNSNMLNRKCRHCMLLQLLEIID